MFGLNAKKVAMLETRARKLEAEIITLMEERVRLVDENEDLSSSNKQLQQKKQMDDEMVAHKLKMREEQIIIDSDKKIAEAERAADKRVAKTKDEYRDKVESQLEKRGDELKGMYSEILAQLPDVSLAISQKS